MIPPDVRGAAIDLLRSMLDDLASRLANDAECAPADATEDAQAAEERYIAERLAPQLARYRARERQSRQRTGRRTQASKPA